MTNSPSPGQRILHLWQKLTPLPGGSWAFCRLLGWMVPYSGSIGPRVLALEPGHARVSLRDRRSVRNHLNSIHAVALVNLGELTSGLAMITALPPKIRSIVTGLEMQFLKKARGVLVAECRCTIPGNIGESTVQVVHADIVDQAGDVVARASVTWLLSPPPPP